MNESPDKPSDYPDAAALSDRPFFGGDSEFESSGFMHSPPPSDPLEPPDLPDDVQESYRPRPSITGSAKAPSGLETRPLPRFIISSGGSGGRIGPGATNRPDDGPAFNLKKQIGKGGFGEVWEARQMSLDRTVAVKRLHPELLKQDDAAILTDQSQVYKFLFYQEALTTARLEHPNIVPVHDLGVDEGGTALLAMKLVKGDPWDKKISREFGSYPVADFLARHLPILTSVAQAVSFAHSKGIVHRDLKPSQVMIGEFGEVMLMDWGLAMAVDQSHLGADPDPVEAPDFPTMVSATNPAGTVAFMAPEQTEPTVASIGTWTDVYLLGGTLYYLLTGRVPHDSPNKRATFYQAREGLVKPPASVVKSREVPEELAAIAMKALSRRRQDRYSSAATFREAIEDYLSGASRRKQSAALTTELDKELAGLSPDTGYDVFSKAEERLNQAAVFWDKNPAIPPLREGIYHRYSKAALQAKDLKLAEMQLRRLEEGDARKGLERELSSIREAARRQVKQRKLAIGISGVLLLLLIAGGAMYGRDQRAARLQVESALSQAEESANNFRRQRDASEELVSYLMGDLSNKLEPLGRIKLMEDVVRRTMAYYNSLDPKTIDFPARLTQGTALIKISDLFSLQGLRKEAAEATRLAEELIRPVAESPTDEGPGKMALSSIWAQQAEQAIGDSDYEGALKLVQRGEALLAPFVAEGAENVELLRSQASLVGLRGIIDEFSSNTQGAYDHYKAARDLAEKAAKLADNDPEILRDVARYESHLARVALKMGDLKSSEAHSGREVGILTELVAAHPDYLTWKYDLVASHDSSANLLSRQGRLEGTAQEFRDAIKLLEELVAAVPANMEWRAKLGSERSSLGIVLLSMKNYPEAVVILREAIEDFIAVELHDGGTLLSLRGKSLAMVQLGRALRASGEEEEGFDYLAEGLDLIRDLHCMNESDMALMRDEGLWSSEFALANEKSDNNRAYELAVKGKSLLEQLVQKDRNNSKNLKDLLGATFKAARIANNLGLNSEYRARLTEHARLAGQLAEKEPESTQLWAAATVSHIELSDSFLRDRNAEAAEAELGECVRTLTMMEQLSPPGSSEVAQQMRARLVLQQGFADALRGRTSEAEAKWTEALQLASAGMDRQPESLIFLQVYTLALFALGREEEALPLGEYLREKNFTNGRLLEYLRQHGATSGQ